MAKPFLWGALYLTLLSFCYFYSILHVYIYATVEVLKILSLDCNDEKLSDLHHKFLGHLWEVFNAVCRSLNELRYLVSHMSLLLYVATKHMHVCICYT